MYLVSQEITDLKSEFEGGSSLSVDWYALLRRGMDKMLGRICPETLKRVVPIYGGFTTDAHIYYCPDDVLRPSRLYVNSERITQDKPYRYRSPKSFFEREEERVFTIVYINKVRFIVLRQAESKGYLTIDDMDDYTAISGTAGSIAQNTYNYLTGSGAVQASFDDSGKYVGASFSTAKDISSYLFGALIVPVWWDSASKVSSVAMRLLTSAGNYFEVASTSDSISDKFKDGLNILRFDMTSRASTGSPDATSIASWELYITLASGQTMTVIIDRITLQKSAFANFEYYSNKGFIDGDDGSWKSAPESGDSINLNRDTRNILHYETCRLTGRQPITAIDFTQELVVEYEKYERDHPSSAEPVSYNITPLGGPAHMPQVIGQSLPQGWEPIDYD